MLWRILSVLKNLKRVGFAFVFLCVVLVTQAQPPGIEWRQLYPVDFAYGMAKTPDGGYVVCGNQGFPDDGYLLKVDSLGEFEWFRTPGASEVWDTFHYVAVDQAGNHTAVGLRYGHPLHFDFGTLISRSDSEGNEIWTRDYNIDDRNDDLHAVLDFGNDDVICVGQAYQVGPSSDDGDFLIMRVDDAGDTVWTRTYGTELPDIALAVARVSDSTFVVAGNAGHYYGAPSDSNKVHIISLDLNGDTLWARTARIGQQAQLHDIVVRGSQIVIAGYSREHGDLQPDIFAYAVDIEGAFLWSHVYEMNGIQLGRSIEVDVDSNFVIFGSSKNPTGQLMIKVDSFGDTIWTQLLSFPEDDNIVIARAVINPDGSYVISALRSTTIPDSNGALIIKTYPDGTDISNPHLPAIPHELDLSAFPNPFNTTTEISFEMPRVAHATIKVYDVLGREQATLLDDVVQGGARSVMWNAEGFASGIYFVRLSVGDVAVTKKVALVR